VKSFGEDLQKIIDVMFETVYKSENCAALAANQVGISLQVTTIDVSEEKDQPLCLVNPEIVESEGEVNQAEGCMSLAGPYYEKVKRPAKIRVKAFDRHGVPLDLTLEGFLAKCVHHEVDHLRGKVFIDRIPGLKRKKILAKIAKSR
jgi:peptide deformylase